MPGVLTDLPLPYLHSVPSDRADDEAMPLVVLMHGRGADAFDLADLAPILDVEPGCRFLLPNAPKPFEPTPGTAFGWTWFDGWPPMHDSLVTSRGRLIEFLKAALTRYPTPSRKLVLAGFSQGALMSLDSGLRSPQLVSGIIALSGGLYEKDLGETARHAGVPVFIAHGLYDDVVPIQNAQRARRVLEDAGLDVEYHDYPMAHQIADEEIAAVRGFLARVV